MNIGSSVWTNVLRTVTQDVNRGNREEGIEVKWKLYFLLNFSANLKLPPKSI